MRLLTHASMMQAAEVNRALGLCTPLGRLTSQAWTITPGEGSDQVISLMYTGGQFNTKSTRINVRCNPAVSSDPTFTFSSQDSNLYVSKQIPTAPLLLLLLLHRH